MIPSLAGATVAVLEPKGMIAAKERDLIFTAIGLMSAVVLPVLVATVFIARKYRAGNTKSEYSPESGAKPGIQFAWWAYPCLVIIILSAVTWKNTHELDPHKPVTGIKPLTIQVVALRWKWLFIYPDQNIAALNFVELPAKTPITFELTADEAPMNSFWIPQLGGQMYAMSGMVNQLNLIADSPGDFQGSAAEISGQGFAGMRFIARATSQSDFNSWVSSVKNSSQALNYEQLVGPSENDSPAVYASVPENLYNMVVDKYSAPQN